MREPSEAQMIFASTVQQIRYMAAIARLARKQIILENKEVEDPPTPEPVGNLIAKVQELERTLGPSAVPEEPASGIIRGTWTYPTDRITRTNL